MKLPVPWLILPLVTGVLLWLSFFPVGWGFLAWLALVPLLPLVRMQAKSWQIYSGAYVGGLLFYVPAISWMSVADYRMVYTWLMLSAYCALYFPLAILMLRALDCIKGWPLTLTVPIVWTGLEFVRSFFLTGFAWYYLGHTQHHYLAVIQIADLGGVYAITFVLAAVNGCLADWLLNIPDLSLAFSRRLAPTPRWRMSFLAVSLVAATLGYGAYRLSQDDFKPGPRVALLQGNLDQRLRNEIHSPQQAIRASEEMGRYYWNLCRLAALQQPPPDLIIWPETSFPFQCDELPKDLNKIADDIKEAARQVTRILQQTAVETKITQLFGLNCRVWSAHDKSSLYNSALLISPAGNTLGVYHKIHRVPFGEYVPFREWVPFMDSFAPYDFDYGIRSGDKRTRFPLGKTSFGVIICNEDTDPFLARTYGRDDDQGPATDFLVNISNDGWFDGSSEHAEHLAISRFRAVEARKPLVRAVNMGISAVIDSNGRVQKATANRPDDKFKVWTIVEEKGGVADLPQSNWRDFTKVDGVLLATVPLDNRRSFYAWAGDWLPSACWLVIGVIWLFRVARAGTLRSVWRKRRAMPIAMPHSMPVKTGAQQSIL